MVIIAIIFVVLILLVAGYIGSSRQKDFFRRLMVWSYKDSPANLFFRIDPYKPLPEAWKEMGDNAWPTKERLKKWLLWNLAWIGITLVFWIIAVLLAIR